MQRFCATLRDLSVPKSSPPFFKGTLLTSTFEISGQSRSHISSPLVPRINEEPSGKLGKFWKYRNLFATSKKNGTIQSARFCGQQMYSSLVMPALQGKVLLTLTFCKSFFAEIWVNWLKVWDVACARFLTFVQNIFQVISLHSTKLIEEMVLVAVVDCI